MKNKVIKSLLFIGAFSTTVPIMAYGNTGANGVSLCANLIGKTSVGSGLLSSAVDVNVVNDPLDVKVVNTELDPVPTDEIPHWSYTAGFYSLNNRISNYQFRLDKDKTLNDFHKVSLASSITATEYFTEVADTADYASLSVDKTGIVGDDTATDTASEIRKYAQYLAEHNVLDLTQTIDFTNKDGTYHNNYNGYYLNPSITKYKDLTQYSNTAKKTEFLTMLYRAKYGVIYSRPFVFSGDPIRNKAKMNRVEKYKTNDGSLIDADFRYDIYTYSNPSVPELYLGALKSKGIINSDELSNSGLSYVDYAMNNVSSKSPIKINTNPDFGQSWGYSSGALYYKNVNYFKNENMSIMDALKYVEAVLRDSDANMTELEASIISYKYDVKYLSAFDNEDRKTVQYLIACGILNFEDEEEMRGLQGVLTEDFMYKILYRVANENARYKFTEVQLTDQESFWQKRGYSENEIEIIDTSESALATVESTTKVKTTASSEKGIFKTVADKIKGVFKPEKAVAKSKVAQWNIVMRVPQSGAYSYNGWKLEALNTEKSFDNCSDVITYCEASTLDDISIYKLSVRVSASSAKAANQIVQTRLRRGVTTSAAKNTFKGVTTIKDDAGNTVTLISRSTLENTLVKTRSKISFIANNVLENTDTGTIAMLLTKQQIAFVGNKVVCGENTDVMVTTTDNDVYYNLDVICSLLGNAYIKSVGGKDYCVINSFKEGDLKGKHKVNESVASVYSASTGGKLCGVHTMRISGIREYYYPSSDDLTDLGSEVVTENETYYRTNEITSGISSLERTFDYSMGSTSCKATVIVNWQYMIPEIKSSDEKYSSLVQYINSDLKDTGSLTKKQVNSLLYTEPTDKKLLEFWKRNYKLSNALASFMYNKSGDGTVFIRSGYLVPDITILVNKDYATAKANDINGKTGMSEFINSLFYNNGFRLSDQYIRESLRNEQGKYNDWWKYYYLMDGHVGTDDDAIRDIMGSVGLHLYLMDSNYGTIQTYSEASYYSFDPNVGLSDDKRETKKKSHVDYLTSKSDIVYRAANVRYSSISNVIQKDGSDYVIDTRSSNSSDSDIKKGSIVVSQDGSLTAEYLGTDSSKNYVIQPYSSKQFENDSGNGIYYYKALVHPKSSFGNGSYDMRFTDFSPIMYSTESIRNVEVGAINLLSDLYNKFIGSTPNKTEHPESFYALRSKKLAKLVQKNVSDGYYASVNTNDKNYSDAYNLKIYQNGGEVVSPTQVEDKATVRFFPCLVVSKSDYGLVKTSSGYKFKANTSVATSKFLDSGSYVSGINSVIIDQLLLDELDCKDLTSLPTNSKLVMGDLPVMKSASTGNGEFIFTVNLKALSGADNAKEVLDAAIAANDVNSDSVKGVLSCAFSGINIYCDGTVFPITDWIETIEIGSYKKPDTGSGKILYYSGGAFHVKTVTKGKVTGTSEIISGSNSYNAVSIKVRFAKGLYGRKISTNSSKYKLITATKMSSDGPISNLPFYAETLLTDRESGLSIATSLYRFSVPSIVDSIIQEFNKLYRKAFAGDILSLIELIIIWISMYLIVMGHICYCILRINLGKIFFISLAEMFNGNGSSALTTDRFDPIKVLSFGIYNLDDEPRYGRIFVSTMILSFIMYFILKIH